MTEMEYVNIMEAARRCGVSDKTIRRAIHAGKLPARFLTSNRCEIAVDDLETFKPGGVPGHVQTATESRLAALEERVQQLERLVAELRSRQEGPKPKRLGKVRERTTGPFPNHLVSLLPFAQIHNVAEGKVQTHVEMGLLPAKRGEWTDSDGAKVTLALDGKGRQAFYRIYHDVPPFVSCLQCPHQHET